MSYEYRVPPKKRCKRGFTSEGVVFGEKRCVKSELAELDRQFKRRRLTVPMPKMKKIRIKKIKI